tara:strand:+ start:327 stop:995 length:669 start_codon:yes stop_codon:yes gene_type:complete
MANEFNYRNYLKNNPLLTEAKKDEEVKEEYKKDMSEEMKDMDEEMKGDMKKKSSKMKLSEFKAQIKERILAEMSDDLDEADAVSFRRQNSPSYTMDADGGPVNPQPHKAGKSTVEEEMEDMDEEMKDMDEEMDKMDEQEDVEVEDNENIDIDIEKDVKVDDEETESDISIKTSVPGESEEVEAVQGLLTKAQQQAEKLGDEKLMAQIGNTITYFTRKHVVKV